MKHMHTRHATVKPSILLAFILVVAAGTAYAGDVTGSWEVAGPAQSGAWLKTHQTGSTVRFQLELSRGAPSYNTGWIEGEIDLVGTHGVFRRNENGLCEISFDFARKSVLIQEDPERQECCFGHNVHADGTLRRKSTKPPKFSKSDPRYGSE